MFAGSSLEPYKHRPEFTLEKGTNDNHILYSSKIKATTYLYQGPSRKGKREKPFDPDRTVAPKKIVIHNSMFKSSIDQTYLVSYINFLFLPTYSKIRKTTFVSKMSPYKNSNYGPPIKNIRLQVKEVDLHFEDSKRFNTEKCGIKFYDMEKFLDYCVKEERRSSKTKPEAAATLVFT